MPNLENLTGAIEQLFQDINRERTFSIIRHNQFLKILNEIEQRAIRLQASIDKPKEDQPTEQTEFLTSP